MTLAGKTIEYSYEGADYYRVRFEEGTAAWEVLTGDHAGSNRTETAHMREVATDIHFVTWLEPTAEVVSFVVNMAKREITCSYTFENEQFFLQGHVTSVLDSA